MKYLKMLGLTALAALALMAFVGAGAASAETTACKKAEDPCKAENAYGVGTEIAAKGIPGQEEIENATSTSPLGTFHCQATIEGKIETATTPSGKGNLAFLSCEGVEEATLVTNGTVTVHHDGEHNGEITLKDFVGKTKVSGITCFWGGPMTATLTGNATEPVIHLTQKGQKIDTPTHDSSFFCPNEPVWHMTGKVTKPSSLFLTTGV